MNKVVKIILIVVGALIIGSAALTAVLLSTLRNQGTLADTFVTDLANGNTSAAYAMFSPELQAVQDEQTFVTSVATLQLDPSCALNVTGVQSSTSTSTGDQQIISGVIACSSKTLNTATFTFNGDDLLIAYQIQP